MRLHGRPSTATDISGSAVTSRLSFLFPSEPVSRSTCSIESEQVTSRAWSVNNGNRVCNVVPCHIGLAGRTVDDIPIIGVLVEWRLDRDDGWIFYATLTQGRA
jgi:hypothetical protein